MEKLKRGRNLKKGDKVGLTAPAGPVDEKRLINAVEIVKKLGFKVEVGLSCYQNIGDYLAGEPQQRANELNEMFADERITAIFCLRGGYGSAQLLPMLNYRLISEHPKLFVGYSDITALHIALQQHSRLATVHGPMPASDLWNASEITLRSLLTTLMRSRPFYHLQNPFGEQLRPLVPGKAEGILTGGNLTVITSLLGTPYEIETKGKILILEDIGEEPYKIDRMLTQLALSGKLTDAAGIILGTWTDCEPKVYSSNAFNVEQVFQRILPQFNKPVIMNVRAGHCEPAISIPLGRNVKLIPERKVIELMD